MSLRGHDYTNHVHEANLVRAFAFEWASSDEYKRELHATKVVVSTWYATHMVGGEAYKMAAWGILLSDAGKPWSMIAYKLKTSIERAQELARVGRAHWAPAKMAEMLDKHRHDPEIVYVLARASKGKG